MTRNTRLGAFCAFIFSAIGFAGAAQAAQAFDIAAILPITGGPFSFLGVGEQQALQFEEKAVNAAGGVHGAPIHFVFSDDQSSPQTAVQLASRVVAQHPNVMIGSAIVAMARFALAAGGNRG